MTDTFTVRAVIVFLGIIALSGVVGGFYLAAQAKTVPDFIIGITATAIGALGGILSKTSSEPSTNVERTNTVNVAGDGGHTTPFVALVLAAILCGLLAA